MSDVQRYECLSGPSDHIGRMVPCPNGTYVYHRDYAALRQRAEAAERERDEAVRSDRHTQVALRSMERDLRARLAMMEAQRDEAWREVRAWNLAFAESRTVRSFVPSIDWVHLRVAELLAQGAKP